MDLWIITNKFYKAVQIVFFFNLPTDFTTHAFCTTLREHAYCKWCPTDQRDMLNRDPLMGIDNIF